MNTNRQQHSHNGSPANAIAVDPQTLAAGLPYLLGFHPERSLICVWLREGTLVVTQRADLPPRDAVGDDVCRWDDYVDAFFASAAHVPADAAIVILVDATDDECAELAVVLDEQMTLPCRRLLQVRGSRVRDLEDADSGWLWIDSRLREAARRVFAGGSPARARRQIEAECQVDEAALERWGEDSLGSESAVRSLARDIQRDLLDGPVVMDAHRLRDAAAHVEGRDLLLWWAARLPHDRLVELLEDLLAGVRATPVGKAADIAAASAAVAWLAGDGVRANVAVDRCLGDDPDHTLGSILSGVFAQGVPPGSMRDMLKEVPRSVVERGRSRYTLA